MKTSMKKVAAVAVTALALVLGACSSGENSSSGNAGSTGSSEVSLTGDYNPLARDQIQDGGELNLAITEFNNQMNTFHANFTGSTAQIWDWYNPTLYRLDETGNFSVNPDYLTGVKDEIVDGNLVLTFDVVEQAQFNDGTPIDVAAYQNTWRIMRGTEDYPINSSDGYERITSVEQGDSPKQVVVTFDGVYPWWQNTFGILLHPAITTPEIFDTAYQGTLVAEWGAGPYTVGSADFNAGIITFVPNDQWWGNPAKLDKVTFRKMESQAIINAFQAGEIDAASAGTKDNLAIAKSMGDAVDIRKAMGTYQGLLTVNSKAPLLGDVEVRKGIMTGIDRAQLAAIRFNGLDYTENLPGSLLTFQIQDVYEDNFGSVVTYNQEEAKSVLEAAGWVPGSDGIREKDGERLALTYVVVGEASVERSLASALQKMMKDIGVELNITERPSSEWATIIKDRDFDMLASGFSFGDPNGVAYIDYFYGTESPLNMSGTGSEEIDAKIVEVEALTSREEQFKAGNALEREVFTTYGIMPYFNGPTIMAVKKGLANYGATVFITVPKEDIGWAKES